MNDYVAEKVKSLNLPRDRRKQPGEKATEEEAAQYRFIAGKLNFLGSGTLPMAYYVASVFLQMQSNLFVHDLDVANRTTNELKKIDATVVLVSPLVNEYRRSNFWDSRMDHQSGHNVWGDRTMCTEA